MPLASSSILGILASATVSTALLLIYFTNLPLWLDRYNGSANAPTAYLLLLALALAAAFLGYRKAIQITRYGYAMWCFAFITILVLTLFRMYFFHYSAEDINTLTDQLQRGFIALSIAVLVYFTNRSHYRIILLVLAIAAPAIILIEFFNPDLFSEAYKNSAEKVRVSGFWGNENAAAEVVVLCIVLLSKNARKLTLMVIYLLAFLAIVFTGSRAGMAGIAIIGLMLLTRRKLPIYFIAAPIILVLTFSSAVVFIEDLVVASGRDRGSEDFINRITYFFDDEQEEDYSEESRSEVALSGLREAIQRPIAGHATYYIDETHEVGSHNLVVNLFYQFGLWGVFLWLWLAFLLYKQGKGLLTNLELFCFAWFSMFNHNILDYNWWYIFLALTLIPDPNDIKSKAKKRKRKRKRRPRTTGADLASPTAT